MKYNIIKLVLLLVVFGVDLTSAAVYTPTDKIFLSCGAPSDSTDPDGRNWTSDIGSKFALSSTRSTAAKAPIQKPSVPNVPYMTARIFESEFTYSFPVATGRKFVRLYFYPESYNKLNASNAVFSVTFGGYTLMRNFSASLTAEALNFDYIVKEFSVFVFSQVLNITFTPSQNSYAFVNGIEIVSHPDIYSADGTTKVVGQSTGFNIDNNTVLENVYRLNVGGNDISASGDTGLFRSWQDDSNYIFGAAIGVTLSADADVKVQFPPGSPSYIAPIDVYRTQRAISHNASVNINTNLTWNFNIDSGFSYLVRLHLCEITDVITKVNQRVFSVFLNNQTADEVVDVIALEGGDGNNGVPVHKDYIVFAPNGPPQQILSLDLHPYTSSTAQYYDVILNGLEIFKINDTLGNLGGPNPDPLPETPIIDSPNSPPQSGKSQVAAIGGGVGGGLVSLLLVGLCLCFVSQRLKRKKDSTFSDRWIPFSLYRGNSHSSGSTRTNTGSYNSTLPSNLCRHFSISDIKSATNNFDDSLLLGVGGFGKVYRGEIDTGTKVAIKRANPSSEQGIHEFQTEIEMLSKLRHRHLVSLIGYCEENGEMILVYDYMAFGTLREHLYKTEKPPLPWKKRLEICIGAARGLHYLHTGAKHTIIHRDVKTTNILLDDKWVAKVSDFGLSKTGPLLDHTHVSTVVKGSFGYLDPDYFRRQQLTEKSDVYSYGVVLFEVICGRPALNPTLPKEQVSLSEWGLQCYRKGILDQIIDPCLKGKIAPECFKKFSETAVKCLCDVGMDRPSMGDVLWSLEFALQLQESGGGGAFDFEGKNDGDSKSSGLSMSIGGDGEDTSSSAVFSQIMNPKGR